MKQYWGLGSAEQAIWDKEGTGIGGDTCPACQEARYKPSATCDSEDHRKEDE